MSKKFVLYHDNCMDGLAASAIALEALGVDTVLMPVNYQEPFPTMPDNVDYEVYIVDFSYPTPTLQTVRAENHCKKLVVIDHHATAQKELMYLQRNVNAQYLIEIIFDETKSGAVLTWQYFHGKVAKIPQILRYVQDRDLWKWELPYSREISAYLRADLGETQQEWTRYLSDTFFDQIFTTMKVQGEAILRFTRKQVESIASKAILGKIVSPLLSYAVVNVGVTQTNVFISEVGEAICKKFPEADCSLTYFDLLTSPFSLKKCGSRIFSLRSIGNYDVGKTAKYLGGGGHKNAAGFILSMPEMVMSGFERS